MPTADHDDDLMTSAEAARFLRRQPATLRKARWRGNGPPFFRPTNGPRGRVYYRRSELIAWIERGRAGSTAEEHVRREAKP